MCSSVFSGHAYCRSDAGHCFAGSRAAQPCPVRVTSNGIFMITPRFMHRCLVYGLCAATVLLGGGSVVQTTQPGAVGVDRQQYMSGLVSEEQLEQQAAQQYSSLIGQAKEKGQLDVDAAQPKRVKQIAARLTQQVGAF